MWSLSGFERKHKQVMTKGWVMEIWVSSLERVHDVAKRVRPSHIVSLLSPDDEFPILEGFDAGRHHRVGINDIREPIEGYVAPGAPHVETLIDFLDGWHHGEPILIHCWAGISRSTATAFIAACMNNPHVDEAFLLGKIAAASPTAFPNTLIVSHADDILGRSGRMKSAVEALCADDARKERLRQIEMADPFSIAARHD